MYPSEQPSFFSDPMATSMYNVDPGVFVPAGPVYANVRGALSSVPFD